MGDRVAGDGGLCLSHFLKEWNDCDILATVFVDDDDDDDDRDSDDEISWRLSRRCLMVPVFSLANGMVSIESMLEFDLLSCVLSQWISAVV